MSNNASHKDALTGIQAYNSHSLATTHICLQVFLVLDFQLIFYNPIHFCMCKNVINVVLVAISAYVY